MPADDTDTPVVIATLYLAAWTGGTDEPSFTTHSDWVQAICTAQTWADVNDEEDGSRVQILLIQTRSDGSLLTTDSGWEPEPSEVISYDPADEYD